MVIDERVLRLAARGGWIGVDLDGTLFTYDKWVGWNVFGEPIAPMVERVRAWIEADVMVKIVTARVGLPVQEKGYPGVSRSPTHTCRVTGGLFSDHMMVSAIHSHLRKYRLPPLDVQCYKDVDMIELWDDRAVQVVANTGRTLAEDFEHSAREADEAALSGKEFGS